MKQLLAELRHFNVLQEDDLSWMTAIAHPKTYYPGTLLFKEGQPIQSMYLSLSGNLSILESLPNGSKGNLMTLAAGELMGESSLLNNQSSSMTIEAVEQAEVLELSKQQLEQKLEGDLDFAGRFYHLLGSVLKPQARIGIGVFQR
jgi:CRP-like cAMP-binding protein